jgi:flagellin
MLTGSINTNVAAQLAVEVLDSVNSSLQATEKQISTGYRVSDATDDGAAYAVAQRVRSDIGALTTANQQLGNTTGLLQTTLAGLNNVSNALNSARGVLVDLTNIGVQGAERTQYEQQYNSLVASVKAYFQDASYNGATLVGDLTGSSGTFGSLSVVRNEVGNTYTVASFSGSAVYTSVAFTSTQLTSSTTVAGLITATGTFLNQINDLGTALNTYGSASNYLSSQISYNSDKIDSLNTGLGALVDADLTKESAMLQALQTQQQLATQSLTIANQSPQAILKLFTG